ncbi:MAG: hypothetical protein HYZ49_08560 [Chloroflexi bacterium]|nr:hypothetical protein [Chloroflexota bacterium]
MMTPTQQANLDRMARELYDRRRLCPSCKGAVSLANELQGACPHCGGLLLAGPLFDPAQMLATLQWRRVELGLSVDAA